MMNTNFPVDGPMPPAPPAPPRSQQRQQQHPSPPPPQQQQQQQQQQLPMMMPQQGLPFVPPQAMYNQFSAPQHNVHELQQHQHEYQQQIPQPWASRETVIEGYLMKRANVSARRRYFVLAGTALIYYNQKGDNQPKKQMILSADTRVQELGGKAGFQITTFKRAWLLTAETIEEHDRWVQALKNFLQVLRQSTQIGTSLHDTSSRKTYTISGAEFLLPIRYEKTKPLGNGAYGVVISAFDRVTETRVAIKKCPRIFEDPMDAKRIAREIYVLRHLNHLNLLHIIDIIPPEGDTFDDVYIVCELLDTDLYRVIYSKQPLSEEHVQFFLYQILCAIKNIHSANIIHRDLKPCNVLLNENCDLKICDFGLSRDVISEEEPLTEYVVTRWYRAPEIMLSSQVYTKAIDIWSVGCIFGELLGRKPIFPGNDYIHQLELICSTVGTPQSEEELHFVKNPKAKRFMFQLPYYSPSDLSLKYPHASPEAVNLLSRMLVLDPKKRVTVEEALDHPYFAEIRDPSLEYPAESVIDMGPIENCEPSIHNLQRKILEDIVYFHPESAHLLMEHDQKYNRGINRVNTNDSELSVDMQT